MNSAMKRKGLSLALLLVPVVFLPGCGALDWVKDKLGMSKKSDAQQTQLAAGGSAGDALVSMNGKTIITKTDLDQVFDQVLAENPQLKAVLPLMPDAKYNVLMGMVTQAIVDRYVADNKIDQRDEYQKELENMTKSVKRMLNARYFGVEHPVAISDEEVKKFYDDNKASMPDLLVSKGGVKAAGLPFDKEADAKAFAAKVNGKDLSKAATEAGLKDKVSDFKLVNAQSVGIDAAVRNVVVGMKKFPATEVVKGTDGKFWVAHATGAEQATYRPFDQVKAALKQFVEKEKRMEMFDKEVNQLKDKYNVVVNEAAFKAEQEQAKAAEDMQQEVGGLVPQRARVADAQEKGEKPKAARAA